jgi:two-component system osmolarity sensor histidine kinase EnvZ
MERDLNRQLRQKLDAEFQIFNIPKDKRVTVHIQMDRGLLTVGIPEGRLFSSSSYIFLLWMVGLSLFLFTIAMIFLRNQIRPIYRLSIIAERLGRGIPVGKIKPSGAREVRQAAAAFINMQERINQYVQQRTTMLASVSHDLRTPLTRMKLQLEMIEETPDTKALRDDINDMERMIEGYLSFAKGDGGEDMQRVDFSDLLSKSLADARRLGLEVDDQRPEHQVLTIWAKPIALSRAFQNFISNAARYASKISIDVREISSERLEITIEDNGEGIPMEQREAVLKPFMRGEASRNQKTGGVGLGLTIANDIIVSHGGSLTLGQSRAMGGLRLVIHLPL